MGEGVVADVARTQEARGTFLAGQAWASLAREAAGRCFGERIGKLGARVKAEVREGVILDAVLHYVRAHPKVAWVCRMNSGVAKLKGFRVRFGFVGCADLIGQLKDGRFLAIEIKTLAGRLTVEQSEFLHRVKHHRGVSGVARCLEDAEKLLAEA